MGCANVTDVLGQFVPLVLGPHIWPPQLGAKSWGRIVGAPAERKWLKMTQKENFSPLWEIHFSPSAKNSGELKRYKELYCPTEWLTQGWTKLLTKIRATFSVQPPLKDQSNPCFPPPYFTQEKVHLKGSIHQLQQRRQLSFQTPLKSFFTRNLVFWFRFFGNNREHRKFDLRFLPLLFSLVMLNEPNLSPTRDADKV